MNWKYVKPLKSIYLVNRFECLTHYKLPKEFVDCVSQFNGGRPERNRFNTAVSTDRSIKTFLSFNPEDRDTVWKIHKWNRDELGDRYAAFAIDHFGNLICFYTGNGSVVFWNHENSHTEYIADTFSEFIDSLEKQEEYKV